MQFYFFQFCFVSIRFASSLLFFCSVVFLLCIAMLLLVLFNIIFRLYIYFFFFRCLTGIIFGAIKTSTRIVHAYLKTQIFHNVIHLNDIQSFCEYDTIFFCVCLLLLFMVRFFFVFIISFGKIILNYK